MPSKVPTALTRMSGATKKETECTGRTHASDWKTTAIAPRNVNTKTVFSPMVLS